MAANGEIELDFADGRYKFNVAKIGQAVELEEKCGAGLHEIREGLAERRWRVTWLVEIHRLGLIGGGMAAVDALRLVRRYVEGRPWLESVKPAHAIVLAALVGVPGDNAVGKGTADQTKTEATENPGALSDPRSTESAPQ